MRYDATRRTILRGGLAGAAGMLGAALPAGSVGGTAVATRRDVNSLAVNDPVIVTYAAAVRYLRSLPSNDRRSWTYLSIIHQNWCPHQNWYLLPWHREYTLALERIIRSLPPAVVPGAASFMMPYWDWTRNPQLPAAFSRPTLGNGSANPLFVASRSPSATTTIPSELVGSGAMRRAYAPTAFETFASGRPPGQTSTHGSWQRAGSTQGPLEATPHNGVHNWIAGEMITMTSPRDPLFFLHHANVDRIWQSWNRQGNADTTSANWLNFTFAKNFARPDGTLYDVRVRNISTSSYRYDRFDPRPAGAATAAGATTTRSFRTAEVASLTLRAADVAAKDEEEVATDAVTRRIQLPARRVLPSRATLRILDLTVPPDLLAGLVRVFVNHPALGRDPAPEGPSYVGTLAFLGGARGATAGDTAFEPSDICGAQRNCFSFELPLTDTLGRRRAAGLALGGELTVQLVPVGQGSRLARARLRPVAVEASFF